MKEPVAIQYRDFYDVPRLFIAEFGGVQFLFDASFNDTLDDYPDEYAVSILPRLRPDELAGSWQGLSDRAVRKLGQVPIASVTFDADRRRYIEAEVLRDLMSAHST